jgi:hypothetical protein
VDTLLDDDNGSSGADDSAASLNAEEIAGP